MGVDRLTFFMYEGIFMKLIFRMSLLSLSCLTLNAATTIPQAPKAVAPTSAIQKFEDLTLGKQPLKVLSQLVGSDKPFIAKFYIPGCPYCKATEAGFEQLAKKYQGKAEFVIVDTTRFDLGRSYGVTLHPTFIIFHKGKKVAQFKRGGNKKEGYEESIEKSLKKLGIGEPEAKA